MATTTTLSFTYTFSPLTKMRAAQVQANFTSVATLLNTTGIGTNNIKDGSITTAKIEDLAVTTGKIADNAVTAAKRPAPAITFSNSVTTFSVATTTFQDVTGAVVTFTVTGRPVMVGLMGNGSGTSGFYSATDQTLWKILLDGAEIAQGYGGGANGMTVPVTVCQHIHEPAAGEHVWKVQLKTAGGGTGSVAYCKLMVWEQL